LKSGVRIPVEEAQVVMPFGQGSLLRWAVMLAGGDGTGLQSLTLKSQATRGQTVCSTIGGEALMQSLEVVMAVGDSGQDESAVFVQEKACPATKSNGYLQKL
jgi:hypothetical protein